jgi:hypothetical protein
MRLPATALERKRFLKFFFFQIYNKLLNLLNIICK